MGLIVIVCQMIRLTNQTVFIKTLEVFNILCIESKPIFTILCNTRCSIIKTGIILI